MVGAKYVNGPFVIGLAAERGDYQGNVDLTGLSQRRGQAIDVGVGYTVAPGYSVYAGYPVTTPSIREVSTSSPARSGP